MKKKLEDMTPEEIKKMNNVFILSSAGTLIAMVIFILLFLFLTD